MSASTIGFILTFVVTAVFCAILFSAVPGTKEAEAKRLGAATIEPGAADWMDGGGRGTHAILAQSRAGGALPGASGQAAAARQNRAG